MSTPSIYPADWQKTSKTNFDWYIQFRFYDPVNKPEGKQRIIKGMNDYKDPEIRRQITEHLLGDEMQKLKAGYNLVTAQYSQSGELHEHTPLYQALQLAFKGCSCDPNSMKEIKHMLVYVLTAIERTGLNMMPVCQVRKKHVRRILDACAQITGRYDEKLKKTVNFTWSADRFNKYRTYLMILFTEIGEVDAIEMNPCRDIKKKKTIKRIRETLTPEQRQIVNDHLWKNHRTFWRLLHIFFHSGARETEIMRVQGKHVNLQKQTYIRVVKKGRSYKEVETTIKDIALPLWTEAMEMCGKDDYVFGEGLAPSSMPIRADQINKRWHRNVKKPLGITADFYSLKHSNTTETVRIAGDQVAANQNAHSGTAMVVKIYDVERGSREHEAMKKVNNPFA
jgi:site-specific recombinase XerC